jgi:hypothetical protein
MFERAPRAASKPLPVQRATEAAPAAPAPAHAAPGAAAGSRTGFADLAVHPPRPNRTGLPDRLKGGIEALSGVSMDGVRVHYNSARPKQLDALATAQGREIHLAPGQAHHLPHEAWHIVQQAQGRVKPTLQAKTGEGINDDHALEREADAMGSRALDAGARVAPGGAESARRPSPHGSPFPAQLKKGKGSKTQIKKAKTESNKTKAQSAATGALNVATFGANWAKRDWREHTKALGLENFTVNRRTDTNKTIFSNPSGHQIVVDNSAKYWRHLDSDEHYVDSTGQPNANAAETHFHHK